MAERNDSQASEYWSATLRLLIGILVVWFVVPFLGGIVFAFYNEKKVLGVLET